MTVIYRIRNLVNGKFYVGGTVRARVRFQTHRRQLRKGAHHCQPLQRAWIKYGEECFKFEIVEHVGPYDLVSTENRWLDEHHGKPHCYNVGRSAEAPMRGAVLSEKTKAAMSKAHKGKQRRLGHTSTIEHRQRISAAMKGKKKSPEHVEKIRQRMLGTSYAKGRIVSDGQRALTARPVVEITQGMEFMSVAAAAKHFGLSRPNLIRTLRADGLVKRGPSRGLHFQHRDALPLRAE